MQAGIRVPENHAVRYDDKGQAIIYPILPMSTLVENVVGWADRVGILEHAKWFSQATKLLEEAGEEAGGVARKKVDATKDAIGDICFLISVVSGMAGLDPVDILETKDDYVSLVWDASWRQDALTHRMLHRTHHCLSMGIEFLWAADHLRTVPDIPTARIENEQHNATNAFRKAVCYMRRMATTEGYSLEEAFSMAWDIVRHRKGRMNEMGAFVKMTDPAFFEPKLLDAEKFTQLKKNVLAGDVPHWAIVVGDVLPGSAGGAGSLLAWNPTDRQISLVEDKSYQPQVATVFIDGYVPSLAQYVELFSFDVLKSVTKVNIYVKEA